MGQNNVKHVLNDDVFKREVEILKHLEPCPNKEVKYINGNGEEEIRVYNLSQEFIGEDRGVLLDRINEFRVSEELDQRFFDKKLMDVISCLYGNLWVVDKNLFLASDKDYFRITNNFSAGAYGTVFLAAKGGSNLKFIIKSNTHPLAGALTVHELFIALVVTNRLRAYCPNFSFVYGGFVCGTPNTAKGEICEGALEIPYMIYEYIFGYNLRDYMSKQYEPREVIAAMLQVYFALRIAKEKGNDFAHRDLHTANVIMRPLKQKTAIKYVIFNSKTNSNETYYVYSSYVATLIDYGFSEAYLPIEDGKILRFGDNQYPDPVVNGKQISHIRDLQKLIGFIAYGITNQENGKWFKNIMGGIYLTAIKPYLLRNGAVRNYQDMLKILEMDRKDFFSPGPDEAISLENKEIDFENFILIVKGYIPENILSQILYQDKITIDSVENIGGVNPVLPFPILQCDEKCLDTCSTFANIMLRDPQGQAESAGHRPDKLAYHALDAEKSYAKFKDNKEYAPYAKEKVDSAVEEMKKHPDYIRDLNTMILNKLNYIIGWMQNPLNVIDNQLYQRKSSVDPYADIQIYKAKLHLLFEFIKTVREMIELNNSLSILNSSSNKFVVLSIYKQNIIKTVNTVNEFLKTTIYPLKSILAKKSNTGYFHDMKVD